MRRDEAEIGGDRAMKWGSDVVAEMLRRLGIDHVCLNPGSSFRGLQDSLVNYLGNERPTLLLALHEESVVAIAHGYAKLTGRPMAVVVHSNVGLMHGLMAVYNAWCDRVPVLMLGATGVVDAAVRRSWIDWVHTFRDQAAMLRAFLKWDDVPASPAAAVEALLRAHQQATTPPCGPAYVVLDRRLQEDALAAPPALPDPARFAAPARVEPSAAMLAPALALLAAAERPLILMGRMSRSRADWGRRIRLAETLGARVLTDLRSAAAFPTDHPLHGGPPDLFLATADRRLVAAADVVLALDWPDLADVMVQARDHGPAAARIIHASLDHHVHNGCSMDHQRLAPADIRLALEPDALVAALLDALPATARTPWSTRPPARAVPPLSALAGATRLSTLADIGLVLRHLLGGRNACLVRVPLNWPGDAYPFRDPLEFLGYDGGGGVGSGPGMAVGAALALEGSGRLAVAIMGDGEFLAAPSALWTAAHYRIPVLVVADNRSYYTDEVQQELVARHRGRAVANKWIGQRIDDPPVDIAGLARDFGVSAEGPVRTAGALAGALERGLAIVDAGAPHLVAVAIDPEAGSNLDWLAEA